MYIKLRVVVDSKKEEIEKIPARDGWNDDTLRVYVKESAEMNMANNKILELMRKYFNTNNIRLVSGHHSPSKIISVD